MADSLILTKIPHGAKIMLLIMISIMIAFFVAVIVSSSPAHVGYSTLAVLIVSSIFIASFSHITTFVGNNDNREWIKDYVNEVTVFSLLAISGTVPAAIILYDVNPASIMYLLLFMAFMGFGLAWAACAIALIKRK
jgi:hypothetical protein